MKAMRITIESHQVKVIRRLKGDFSAWCETCGAQSQLVTPEEAAEVVAQSCRQIYQWIEAEKVHYKETANGRIFICLNSLYAMGT